MNNRYAKVQGGKVVNVAVFGDEPPADWIATETAGPGWTYDGEFRPAVDEEFAPLSRPRFEWLLAFTGLGDAWDALAAWAKVNDRATFARLAAHRAAPQFDFETTVAVVANMRPALELAAPGFDVSDETIQTAWQAAQAVNLKG